MIRIRINKKHAGKLLAKLILASEAIVLNITLISAQLNNGQILVTTNTYNEGMIEMILIPIVTIWSIYTLLKKQDK